MARALLALGSNLGAPAENLRQAAHQLQADHSIQILARSNWLRNEAVGGPANQEAFLNGCILVQTPMEPMELASALHEVENLLGRERQVHWGPRTIDIDLLLYDQQIFHSTRLEIPHPRMSFRNFVLQPALEIVPYALHPTTGWTIAALVRHLGNSPELLAIISENAENARSLSVEVCRRVGGQLVDDLSDLSNFLRKDYPKRSHSNKPLVLFSSLDNKLPCPTVPSLTVVWDVKDADAYGAPEAVLDRMQWRGPAAVLQNTELEAVADGVVCAIRAAWPTFDLSS